MLSPFNKGMRIVRGVTLTLKLRCPVASGQVAEQLGLSPHTEKQKDRHNFFSSILKLLNAVPCASPYRRLEVNFLP